MSFAAPLAAKAALSVGANFLGSKLTGKQKGGLGSFAPSGFSGGGLSGSFNPGSNSFSLNASSGRTDTLRRLTDLFPQQAGMVEQLRGLVSPGVGALTQSRLAGIGTRADKAIGDLRENLQRRRVLGSSFGADTLARAEREFAQEEDRVRAESFLQELDLTNQLIQQEFGLRRGEFQTQLDDMNFQAELAAKHSSAASSILASNAQLKEQLNAKSAAGAGRFFGQAAQPLIDGISSRFGSGFGSGLRFGAFGGGS